MEENSQQHQHLEREREVSDEDYSVFVCAVCVCVREREKERERERERGFCVVEEEKEMVLARSTEATQYTTFLHFLNVSTTINVCTPKNAAPTQCY